MVAEQMEEQGIKTFGLTVSYIRKWAEWHSYARVTGYDVAGYDKAAGGCNEDDEDYTGWAIVEPIYMGGRYPTYIRVHCKKLIDGEIRHIGDLRFWPSNILKSELKRFIIAVDKRMNDTEGLVENS